VTAEPPRGLDQKAEEPTRDLSRHGVRFESFQLILIGAVGVAALVVSLAVAPGWSGVAGAVLAALTLAIAVIDHRSMIIPNELNATAFIAGLAAAVLGGDGAPGPAIAQAVARAALMFAFFFVFRAAFRALRGVEGMGFGDVKLAAVAGAWLDWSYLPVVIEIATLSALAAALIARFRGGGFDLKQRLPFGTFFAPAIWVCWLVAAWRGG
jgi:leader peptidase (prepilin peptidase) / N-methyltransferase